MLANCAADGNRVAILDMRHGFATRDGPTADPVAAFRNTVGSDNLEFGAAYYPWLQLPLFSENDFTYENIAPASHNLFASLMASDLRARNATEGAMQLAQILLTIDKIRSIASSKTASPSEQGQLHDALSGSSDLYRAVMSAIATRENTQSPGGFMTGLNAGGDDMIGPWDLPAHSTLAMALKPSVTISRSEEMDLNSAADGKMVNTIRGFNARGMVIGEAQTLGGGYSDWRYFAARKTVSVIEQDLRTAIAAYATDDNDLNTLTKMWRDRELQGSHASNAFSVRVGLGDTMTVQDIVDGTLRVVAYLAPVYPNEYTVLTLEQPMERP